MENANKNVSKKIFNTPYVPELYVDSIFETMSEDINSRVFVNMLLWFMEKKFGFLENNERFGKSWYEKYIDFTVIQDLGINEKDKGFQPLKYDCEFCDRLDCDRKTCLKYDAFWLMVQFMLGEVDKNGNIINKGE